MRVTQKTLSRYQEIEVLLKDLQGEKDAIRKSLIEHGGGSIGDFVVSVSETTSERLVGKEQVAEVFGGIEKLRQAGLVQNVSMTSVRVTLKVKKAA